MGVVICMCEGKVYSYCEKFYCKWEFMEKECKNWNIVYCVFCNRIKMCFELVDND